MIVYEPYTAGGDVLVGGRVTGFNVGFVEGDPVTRFAVGCSEGECVTGKVTCSGPVSYMLKPLASRVARWELSWLVTVIPTEKSSEGKSRSITEFKVVQPTSRSLFLYAQEKLFSHFTILSRTGQPDSDCGTSSTTLSLGQPVQFRHWFMSPFTPLVVPTNMQAKLIELPSRDSLNIRPACCLALIKSKLVILIWAATFPDSRKLT
mmetsp:Transcript_8971/g.19365  ORF Transcript_8971/g.19365 Transcript_8971/m.19365 type:complete len:206 (-) Transcript_8971:1652-2269(-)